MLIVLIVLLFVGWDVAYLTLWYSVVPAETFLNRLSWCTAEIFAVIGLAIGVYMYQLFYKGLQSDVAGQFMEFAADPKNQAILDKALRNILKTPAVGEALDIAVEYAKKKITSSFEGRAGSEIKKFKKGMEGMVPDYVKKWLDHPWVDNGIKAIGIMEQILVRLKGGTPPEPPDQSQQ